MKFRDVISHAHIDYPLGECRRFPQRGDGYDYSDYLGALGASGYEGILTIEATFWNDSLRRQCQAQRFLRREIHMKAGV